MTMPPKYRKRPAQPRLSDRNRRRTTAPAQESGAHRTAALPELPSPASPLPLRVPSDSEAPSSHMSAAVVNEALNTESRTIELKMPTPLRFPFPVRVVADYSSQLPGGERQRDVPSGRTESSVPVTEITSTQQRVTPSPWASSAKTPSEARPSSEAASSTVVGASAIPWRRPLSTSELFDPPSASSMQQAPPPTRIPPHAQSASRQAPPHVQNAPRPILDHLEVARACTPNAQPSVSVTHTPSMQHPSGAAHQIIRMESAIQELTGRVERLQAWLHTQWRNPGLPAVNTHPPTMERAGTPLTAFPPSRSQHSRAMGSFQQHQQQAQQTAPLRPHTSGSLNGLPGQLTPVPPAGFAYTVSREADLRDRQAALTRRKPLPSLTTTVPFADLHQASTNGRPPSLSSDLDGCRRPQQLRAPQPRHEVNPPAVIYPAAPAAPRAQGRAAMTHIGTNVRIPSLHPSVQNRGGGQSAHAWGSEHNVQAPVPGISAHPVPRAPGTVAGPSRAAVQQGRITPAAVRTPHNSGAVEGASRTRTFSSSSYARRASCPLVMISRQTVLPPVMCRSHALSIAIMLATRAWLRQPNPVPWTW
ncbi:hypothetical protein CERSUDRAFT_118027 [Gelatoporia subvermispora B]|uniref:Uncharacterized protein n=1 Tax=Ceriporiopsis subvermispora (strain B) TaxID=914234 RepID=M2PCL4_CERS8|nr:hypothetical protein CERSUDRAFT_118027 [Gelatoporia subvermispora B]